MRINRILPAKQHFSKTRHLLIAGLSGYGKGNVGEFIISQSIGKEKVFDLHSESRGEGMFYLLPQDDKKMLERIDWLTNGILKPRTFPNEIIMFRGKNLFKIHELPKNIKVCVFNEKWVTNDDLKKFVSSSEKQSEFMETIYEIHNDKPITLSYLYDYLMKCSDKKSKEAKQLKEYGSHYMTVNTIKRKCRTLLRSGIFYNSLEENLKDFETGYFQFLNLMDSLNDVDTITTFSTYLIEDEYIKYVAESVLLKKFIELIETRQSRVDILFYIREVNDYYYKKSPEAYVLDVQSNIEKILRKGRSLGGAKITCVLDTQLLNDIPDSVFNGFNKFLCFRLPLKEVEKLLRKATLPKDIMYKMTRLEVGQCAYIINGGFEYYGEALPTLHKKHDPEFDVFKELINEYGMVNYNNTLFVKKLLSLQPIIEEMVIKVKI